VKRLIAQSFEVNEAKDNGRLAVYDADQALSQFMDAAGPSRKRFLLQFGDIVRRAWAAAAAKNGRVVIFGEIVAVLWSRALVRVSTTGLYCCSVSPSKALGRVLQKSPNNEAGAVFPLLDRNCHPRF